MFGFAPFAGAAFADLGGSATYASLTGVSGTGAVGNLGLENINLSGVYGTGSVGSVLFNIVTTASISGVSSGATSVGTMIVSRDYLLAGNQATGAIGTVAAVYWKLIDTTETAGWITIDTS